MNLDFACEELKARIENNDGSKVDDIIEDIVQSLEVDSNLLKVTFAEIYGCSPKKYLKNIATGDEYSELSSDIFMGPDDDDDEDGIEGLGVDFQFDDDFDLEDI